MPASGGSKRTLLEALMLSAGSSLKFTELWTAWNNSETNHRHYGKSPEDLPRSEPGFPGRIQKASPKVPCTHLSTRGS